MFRILYNLRNSIIKYGDSNKQNPVIVAIASGLYPLLYYYNSNFTLVNSWTIFLFFIGVYLIAPILVFTIVYFSFNNDNKIKLNFISALNISLFVFLIILSTIGFNNSLFYVFPLFGIFLGIFLSKYLNKIIIFQFLLSVFVFLKLIPDFYKILTYSNEWRNLPDNIEEVVFKKKPNIYIIQSDGYANFSELKRGFYNFDNSEFEDFLRSNSFKLYDNYRSNYVSTLSSNSSMFAMKHHYYNNTKSKIKELYGARQIIAGDNPVVSIMKKNGYKTFFMLEYPYLLVNRPKLYYDYCNIKYSEISFFSSGFEVQKNLKDDISHTIDNNFSTNNFYFIEKMQPGHITTYRNKSSNSGKERDAYLSKLEEANNWLQEVVNLINRKDKKALIVLVSDHGGYVGLDYTLQSKIKQTNRDLIFSMFTSVLAIKWTEQPPNFETKLISSVNLFRILFSYLSGEEIYLNYLEDDSSYSIIEEGALPGVYKYIDKNNNEDFKQLVN